ncbi:MAG: hypothetical protein K0R66_878 [Gammaproteobacteria bacterium]|nr:hypothetical protein [Gammaproteobacteria bacterium]
MKFSDSLIRAFTVLIPAFPIAILYSQVPFAWWKVLAYLILAYVIAVVFSCKLRIKSHRLHALGVLISLIFIGTVITLVQDFYIIFPPNINIWELVGLSLLFLAAGMVGLALLFWIYWKLDSWACKSLIARA